jgi:hypothetical protein
MRKFNKHSTFAFNYAYYIASALIFEKSFKNTYPLASF